MHKNEQMRRWIAIWQKADTSLRSIKIKELQNKDYYLKNRDVLNDMLQYAFDKQNVRVFSGLVIQQDTFKSYYLKKLRT